MADNTFVVHADWLDAIDKLPLEAQDKIIADCIRYGCRRELQHAEEPDINSFVNLLKGRIDHSIDKWQGKVDQGKSKIKATDQEVYAYARQGFSAQEIADMAGVKKNTIQHKQGWIHRHEDNWRPS